MDTVVFDSLGDAVDTADDQAVAGLSPLGTSFSTAASAGTLSSVTLGLFDKTPSDGGTLTVQLRSDASGNVPGTPLETLGTIGDSKLGTADTSTYTLSGFASYTLAANTRCWVEVSESAGSQAALAYSDGDGGAGVASEYSYLEGYSSANSSIGTNISEVNTTPCYCPGTLILTARGEVAVEAMSIGDVVVTASGEHRPVRWIGHRGYGGRFANGNPDVLPVCVHAGALADGVPERDLWVSPKHALFLDGRTITGDLLAAGVGAGRHAFRFALPANASAAVTVARAADGALLPGLAGEPDLRVA